MHEVASEWKENNQNAIKALVNYVKLKLEVQGKVNKIVKSETIKSMQKFDSSFNLMVSNYSISLVCTPQWAMGGLLWG